jgi:hypothetical protein
MYDHMDDGEKDFNHNAMPDLDSMRTGDEFARDFPTLFKEYKDGKIGPNSRYHKRVKRYC